MKTQFYQVVDLRSKKEMIDFLVNHYRYNTMNSWNQSTSYANKMKVYDCIPSEFQDKVFELMESEGFYDSINYLLEDWNEEQGQYYQAGFNGRSGGYIVMYEGSVEIKTLFTFDNTNQYQSRDYEDGYGWMTVAEAKDKGLYKKQVRKIGCYAGRSIDQGEDFTDWSTGQLKERVKLVQSFDKLCDDVVNSVIYMAEHSEVKEEEYIEVKTRKVIEMTE